MRINICSFHLQVGLKPHFGDLLQLERSLTEVKCVCVLQIKQVIPCNVLHSQAAVHRAIESLQPCLRPGFTQVEEPWSFTCWVIFQHRVLAEWLEPPCYQHILLTGWSGVVTTQDDICKQCCAPLCLRDIHLDCWHFCVNQTDRGRHMRRGEGNNSCSTCRTGKSDKGSRKFFQFTVSLSQLKNTIVSHLQMTLTVNTCSIT